MHRLHDMNQEKHLVLGLLSAALFVNGGCEGSGAVARNSLRPAKVLSFRTAPHYNSGSFPDSIAVGDLNGDGKADLAVANDFDAGGVSVLLNRGDGTFAAPVHHATGASAVALAIADLDGDGDGDIAVASTGDGPHGSVSVLLNDGGGTFAAAVDYEPGDRLESVVAGDVNGDGKVDLIVTGFLDTAGQVGVLLNNGTGTFSSAIHYPVSLFDPRCVAIGDLNGDGKADLVVSASDQAIAVLLNAGDGTFALPSIVNSDGRIDSVGGIAYSVVVRDLNGDRKPDLAVTHTGFPGTVSVLMNAGNGTFAASVSYVVGQFPRSLDSGDLDGDGDIDLAVADFGSGNVSALLNHGDGTFAPPVDYAAGAEPFAVAVGDLNGDGKADLAVADHSAGDVTLLLNEGSGTFVSAPTYAAGVRVVAGDLNGDGKPDLVAVNRDQGVRVLLNDGAGAFAAANTYPSSLKPGSSDAVAIGDLNGDGAPDLVVSDNDIPRLVIDTFAPRLPGRVNVLLNDGKGGFVAGGGSAAGLYLGAVAVGDLDGDGKQDLAVVEWLSTTVSVLLNQGGATFAAAVDYTAGERLAALTIGDLNGDGKQDLVVADWASHGVSVLSNQGNGTFAAPVPYATGTAPRSVILTDLDGDGWKDVVVANDDGGTVSVLPNRGRGHLSLSINYDGAGGLGLPWSIDAADLNDDGRPDLAVASSLYLSVLLNDGQGAFGAATHYSAGGNPQSVAAVDLNADGMIDLAVGNNGGNVSVLRNTSR
jgi:FG-GAP-like repeat